MRPSILVGIVLVAIGIISLIYQGITYTERKKAVDIGPVEVTTENKKTIPLPPIVGGLALAAGVTLIAVGSKKFERA